ncbi:hypothetical protein [Nocardia noduli]|uniref:hypothetical protein n=1 Tax=Nocardia noduli TaxID=2815722 RepID=UPI001C214FE1|nr:hypothetical protein [Nocardia noduli]
MTSPTPIAAATDRIDPNALVLAQRPLRPGARLADTPRYHQDRWDLSRAVLQKQQPSWVLDFTTLPPPFQQTAKQLFYCRLTGDLPEGERPRSIASIRTEFSAFKIVLAWLYRRGRRRLADVVPEDIETLLKHLVHEGKSRGWRVSVRGSATDLWTYRSRLTDALVFDPSVVLDDVEGVRGSRGENTTDRISEPILGPLLGWALRYVQELSGDILTARTEWASLHARHWTRRAQRRPAGSKTATPLLAAVLDRYLREERPLPGGPVGINHSHLAREADATRSTLKCIRNLALIEDAARQVGVDDNSYLWSPMSALIAGRPWLHRMAYADYAAYEQRLSTACYIVIAYLSGMRDSEVKHLHRGCLTTTSDRTGRLTRHHVTSRAFKGENTAEGVEATWVVGPPVARAIGILEQLQPADQPWLFAPLFTGHHSNQRRGGRVFVNEALTSKATNEDIAGFIAWINTYCATCGLPDTVPDIDGRPARVTTRQFRRTLAWFIARRPGGSIAGAIAYRHHSVQMFEGYAGTSNSGFRAEVEAEQALARGEDLAMMVERHEHESLTGPAAEEGRRRLAEYGRHVRFQGIVPRDRRQFEKLAAQHDPHVYPGRYVTCIHNPDKALCHNGNNTNPALGDCRPLACRNVAITADNTTAWREQLHDIEQELDNDTHTPYLTSRLRTRRDQIMRLIDIRDHMRGD